MATAAKARQAAPHHWVRRPSLWWLGCSASLWVKGENTERVIIRNFVGSGNGYWEVDLGQCTGWERLTSAHPAVTETNP